MELNKNEIAKYLEKSVEWLKEQDQGCSIYNLPNGLTLAVGWSDGFDPEDSTVIHSVCDPSYAICAKIALNTSYMRTDLDLDFSFLYYDNGDLLDGSISIAPNEDYAKLAEYFIKDYNEVFAELEFDEDGLITSAETKYDRRKVESDYYLDDGELDGKSIREAEEYLCIEPGSLDAYLV